MTLGCEQRRIARIGRRTLAAAVAMLALLGGNAGCASSPEEGYSLTPSHDAAIRTVSVPVFGNDTFAPGVEVALTEAIIKEIGRSTPWAIDQSGGDTSLTGRLARSEIRNLSNSPLSGFSQEIGVQMTVDFVWKDNRTGKTLVSRRNFTVMEPVVVERRSSERLELGQTAAVDRLAREIVGELRSAW